MTEYKNRITGSGVEPLDQILFNPRNWRVHPLNQQNALKGVLEEVGWVQEVIINQRTGHLVDGHLRCQLAAREGAKTIPVKYVDLSEEEEALVLSTLDPIAAMATTDKQKLDELFASIETENADVLKMLDDIAEKERLEYAKRDPIDAEPQIDRAAELNEKWQVKTGDMWQIGEHKLLCGDSTKREDVERVMAGEKADMVFTDPPYGINKDGIENDGDLTAFTEAILLTDAVLNPDRYICSFGWIGLTSEILSAVAYDFVWICINHTPNTGSHGIPTGLGFNEWSPLYLWSKGNPKPIKQIRDYLKNTDQSEVSRSAHPTPKNTVFCQYFIERLSDGIVYEPFCGSGTTMVACQNLNRKCRAIEISPNYCAVILERMHTAFPELEIKKLA